MTDTFETARVIRPRGEIVRREIAGETILVPIRGRTADMQSLFALNRTAAFIWERIDGERNIGRIHEEIVAAFDVDRDEARADLEAFLAEARSRGLVEDAL